MAWIPCANVVAPRFLGGVIAMPLLVAIFNTWAFSARSSSADEVGLGCRPFWSQMQCARCA